MANPLELGPAVLAVAKPHAGKPFGTPHVQIMQPGIVVGGRIVPEFEQRVYPIGRSLPLAGPWDLVPLRLVRGVLSQQRYGGE